MDKSNRKTSFNGWLSDAHYFGSTSVEAYALAFLLGAVLGLISSLMFAYNFLRTSHEPGDLSSLGPCWIDNKSLILQALPFAVTLGILPYVYELRSL